MVRISDGLTELAAMAEMKRHEGTAPTIEWNTEMETLFNEPKGESSGRMHNGFLVESFAVAESITDEDVRRAETTLGMGYWQPNPDDTPELFKP